MIQQQYPSQLLEKAVQEFSKLPGIGRKTALRLVLWMLRQDDSDVTQFTAAVNELKCGVKYCKVCHNISDTDICPICADQRRDQTTVCVVENIQDVMAIENTQQFNGVQRPVPRTRRCDIAHGRHGACRHRDRLTDTARRRGHGTGGDISPESNYGRRHHQLLHLPKTGAYWHKSKRDSPRHSRGQRTGVCRRGYAGPIDY